MSIMEEWYRSYQGDVYRYLLSLTHDPALAEELLAETFFRAIVALPSFRGEASGKTWLIGIARNLWLHSLRKRKEEPLDAAATALSESLEDKAQRRQLLTRVKVLLAQKEPRARQVIALRAEGYPYEEIAKRLGISASSARVVEFRTRKWLREQLEKEEFL